MVPVRQKPNPENCSSNSITLLLVYSVNCEPMVLRSELDLFWTELADVEADAEHLRTVLGVVEHVADLHLLDQSVAGVTHVGRLLTEKVRLHP